MVLKLAAMDAPQIADVPRNRMILVRNGCSANRILLGTREGAKNAFSDGAQLGAESYERL